MSKILLQTVEATLESLVKGQGHQPCLSLSRLVALPVHECHHKAEHFNLGNGPIRSLAFLRKEMRPETCVLDRFPGPLKGICFHHLGSSFVIVTCC